MNDIITSMLVAATKVAAVGILTGALLSSYVGAIRWVCPHLREAVAYQELVVATAEKVGNTCAAEARAEWEPRRAKAIQRISALEGMATSLEVRATELFSAEQTQKSEIFEN